MQKDIMEFIKKYNNKLKSNEEEKLKRTLDNILTFSNIKNENDNIMKMVEFAKNTIRNIGIVYPSIIVNKVDKENIKIPTYWGFSKKHNSKLKNNIIEHYSRLQKYYGETTIKPLLENLISKMEMLLQIENNIPIILKTTNKEPLFDFRTLKGLYFYFILSIFDSIIKLSNNTNLIIEQVIPVREETEILESYEVEEIAMGDITEVDILLGEQKNINEILSTMLIDFIKIIQVNKESIDYNEELIKEKVNRAKDNEKDSIVEEFGELKPEAREVENIFKMLRLGSKWGQGRMKGLTEYVADYYDNEMEVNEERENRRNKIRKNNPNSSDNTIDIEEMEMMEKDISDETIEREEYSMENIPDDDDNNGQDDMYGLDPDDEFDIE
jgi:hypothetical protein